MLQRDYFGSVLFLLWRSSVLVEQR
ncbi:MULTISPECIES: hypothetical protein [unclassified Mesorhizobium]|nr:MULTISPECIES: hypothetical protein [unclassified Mesorhizobium]